MHAFSWYDRHTVTKSEQMIVLTQVVGHRKCLSWSGCACVARHLKRGCDIFERKYTVSGTNMMSGALCCWQLVNIIVSTWDRKGGCRLSGCQGRKVGLVDGLCQGRPWLQRMVVVAPLLQAILRSCRCVPPKSTPPAAHHAVR
jgi:hypothetical protein